MSELATVAATIFKRAGKAERYLVAIAGPPASGKSTRAEALADLFQPGTAAVVPMDGFHYDDGLLEKLGFETGRARRRRSTSPALPRCCGD